MNRFLVLTFCLGAGGFSACGDAAAPSLDGIKREVRSKFPEVEELSVEQLADWERERRPLLLVDVREPAEYQVSHLERAIHSQNPREIGNRYKEGNYSAVVVYCSVGYRSAQMARRLRGLGIEPVFNLEGSIFEWANQGRPVFNSDGITDKVHPYDSNWGELLRPELRAPIP